MLVIFMCAMMAIGVTGPGYIEGGFDAINEKGTKEALSTAWKEREPLDYSKLN